VSTINIYKLFPSVELHSMVLLISIPLLQQLFEIWRNYWLF